MSQVVITSIACITMYTTGNGAISRNIFGSGLLENLQDSMLCNGTETSLSECSDGVLEMSPCNHTHGAGVQCSCSDQIPDENG